MWFCKSCLVCCISTPQGLISFPHTNKKGARSSSLAYSTSTFQMNCFKRYSLLCVYLKSKKWTKIQTRDAECMAGAHHAGTTKTQGTKLIVFAGNDWCIEDPKTTAQTQYLGEQPSIMAKQEHPLHAMNCHVDASIRPINQNTSLRSYSCWTGRPHT